MSTPPVAPGQPAGLPPTSPRAGSPGSLGAAAVTAAAIPALKAAASSPTGASLTGAVQAYDFEFNLELADRLLLDGKKNEAFRIYTEIERNIPEDVTKGSLIKAECSIGSALFYYDTVVRESSVRHAKRDFTAVYENRKEWAHLDPAQKASNYAKLISLLNKLKLLLPNEHQELDEKIEECSKHLFRIDAARLKLMEGVKLFKEGKALEAREKYYHALRPIENITTAECCEVKALIFMSYAQTYPQEDVKRMDCCKHAYNEIVSFHAAITTQPSELKISKRDAYQKLFFLCEQLPRLIPTTYAGFLQAFQLFVERCQKEIGEQPHTVPVNRGQPSGSGKGPRRPRNYLRLLVALAFASLVAFAGVALYRRLITKIE